MRLYRLGDTGAPVRDIQTRLAGLGHSCALDQPGEFGSATADAVAGFQAKRGLAIDSIVGPETWRALVEAGYQLGDRLLYLRRPMMRGDDVDLLQRRLNDLGFDAGKVDGIFGPDTEHALKEFQGNRLMGEDGICGPEVTAELRRVHRGAAAAGRDAIREAEWLRRRPGGLPGSKIFIDAGDGNSLSPAWRLMTATARLVRERGGTPLLSRSPDTTFPERVRARRANRMGADLVVSFKPPDDTGPTVFYFASDRSRSPAGEALAHVLGEELELPVAGQATVMLKETRAPAVIVCAQAGSIAPERVIAGLDSFFAQEEPKR